MLDNRTFGKKLVCMKLKETVCVIIPLPLHCGSGSRNRHFGSSKKVNKYYLFIPLLNGVKLPTFLQKSDISP